MYQEKLARIQDIEAELDRYRLNVEALPGINEYVNRLTLAAQLVDSLRRIEYVKAIASRDVSVRRIDPNLLAFDPVRAAIYWLRSGNIDEAAWLIFLSTHCGSHLKLKWTLARELYLGDGHIWTWSRVSGHINLFIDWLGNNHQSLKGKFGNHRKFESKKPSHTGEAVRSYINWVMAAGGHGDLFAAALNNSNGDPKKAFAILYASMSDVRQFGRIGKFDFLTMLGKVGVANIEPDKGYISDSANGPIDGARLLFYGTVSAGVNGRILDGRVSKIDSTLSFGMQAWEDALCNWQKSPGQYRYFGG